MCSCRRGQKLWIVLHNSVLSGPYSHLSILATVQQAYKARSLLHYPKAEPVQRKGLGPRPVPTATGSFVVFPALSVCFSLGDGCWTEHPIIKACLTEGSFQLCSLAFGGRNSAIFMQTAVGMTCPGSPWFRLLVLLCSLGSPLSVICLTARGLGGKMLAGRVSGSQTC